VRLSKEARELARRIVADLSAFGWTSYGVTRTDPPTLSAVVEEGIRALAALKKTKREA
jgi:hypothetical protein